MSETKVPNGFSLDSSEVIRPFKEGDEIEIKSKIDEQTHIEVFGNDLACEDCCEIGAFYNKKKGPGDNELAPLCEIHLSKVYKEQEIRVTLQKRSYVMLWQRAMNSGIIELDPTTLERVRRLAYNKDFVKTTIIEGKVVESFGTIG